MAQQPRRSLFSLLGLVYWGDIGELTVYKSQRGKLVWFQKTWPKEPMSPAQALYRDAIRFAAAEWQTLTPAQRAQWELATKRCSLCMHGYDLWVHAATTGDPKTIDTIERQSDTTLVRPTPVPSLSLRKKTHHAH